MSRAIQLTIAAVLVASCASAHAQTQPPAQKTAPPPADAAEGDLSDAALDAIAFKDRKGVKGTGEAMRLLAEIEPESFAEFRSLVRRFVRSKQEEKPAMMSELLDFNGRMQDKIALQMRRAPLDALDAAIGEVRAAAPEIAATDPELCGVFSGGDQSATIAFRNARPDLVARIDIASFHAVAAARARPATYARYDDALYQRVEAMLKTAGVSPKDIEDLSSEERKAAMPAAARCDLERRYISAIAGLPDDIRGATLAYHFSGDDGSGE